MRFNAPLQAAIGLFALMVLSFSVPGALRASSTPTGRVPVFPGAQGFGTETPAGRGGKIIRVTSLENAGDGSLREAIEASGPRIIVFEVGGTIDLKKELRIKNPFVTVAGQTAPSPGVTLKGAGLIIQAHDVLVQHLRIRVGDALKGPDPTNREALKVSGWDGDVYNVVCDHLSLSWATDEVVSTVYGPHEVTISHSIISEGLSHSLHPEGVHSKAMLVREGTRNLALIGNLFAHNRDRNPRIAGDTSVVAVNNLLYNAGRNLWFDVDLGTHGSAGPHLLSVVGNAFIEGPDTPHYAWPIRVDRSCAPGTKVYHFDNLAAGEILRYFTSFDPVVSSPPVWHPSIILRPAGTVESQVLAEAGARPADRDAVDSRVVSQTKARTGAIVDSVQGAGGWPELPRTHRPFIIPADPSGDEDKDGYTNIEEVLHRMAEEVEQRGDSPAGH